MLNRSLASVSGCVFAALGAAQSPQLTVVPSGYATTDAISYLWIPGASRDVRQQTLVGPSHLAPMLGRTLAAIEFRRTAANEVYQGGTANLAVTLSTSTNPPLRCSRTFAANPGANATLVFTGMVTLPTSPAEPGPGVAWSANNTVRIAFQTPFVYLGGTLCIDVVGLAVAGQTANWWMADAVFEDLPGTAAAVGNGCGAYGGPQGHWSHTCVRGLVPGGHSDFWAFGPQNSLGIAAFGVRAPSPIPLTALGIPSVGCNLHLATIDAMLPALFVPEWSPASLPTGRADVELWIPDSAALFGMTMTTQWFEWSQLATSNAIEWTVAGSMPTLDMAVVEGAAADATGLVTVNIAHVLRFEHQ